MSNAPILSKSLSLAEFIDRVGPLSPHAAASLILPLAQEMHAETSLSIGRSSQHASEIFVRVDATGYATATFVSHALPASTVSDELAAKAAHEHDGVSSLGAVLYECLTGIPPCNPGLAPAMRLAELADQVVHVKSLRPGLSDRMADVVHRALCADATIRFATTRDFAAALCGCLT